MAEIKSSNHSIVIICSSNETFKYMYLSKIVTATSFEVGVFVAVIRKCLVRHCAKK